MAINVFEGGRRIARLLMALWAAVVILIFSTEHRPTIDAVFMVSKPGAAPARADVGCAPDDAREYGYSRKTARGTRYDLVLCFTAHRFPGGMLIPFKIDATGGMPYTVEQLRQARQNALNAGDTAAAERLAAAQATRATYHATEGMWGGEKYDAKVSAYTGRVLRTFVPSPDDEAWIDSQRWRALWKHVESAARWIGGGVLGIWLIAVTIGWIVRGFLGVPTGRDARPDSAA